MKPKVTLLPLLALAGSSLLAVSSASAQTTYTWANSNVTGTPTANRDWFGANKGTWTATDPVSGNLNTIQFFENTTTALPNTAVPSTQAVNLNNSGNAFQLGTLTLSGLASATTNANLTMNLSGDALNFSAATGTINLNALNATRTITYNVANNIQLGTASSASALTFAGAGSGSFNFSGNISELQAGGGSLTKSGSSPLVLSGSNSYTGVTTIAGSTLQVTSLANGGSNSSIGASSSAASNLRFTTSNAAVLSYVGSANASTDRLFTLTTHQGTIASNGTGTVNFTNTGAIVFEGPRQLNLRGSNTGMNTFNPLIQSVGSNVVSVGKQDAGVWFLANEANSYTGTTTVGGTLIVNKMADYGSNSSIGRGNVANTSGISFDAGTLVYAGAGDDTNRTVSFAGNPGTILNNGTGALNFTASTFNVAGNATLQRILTLGGTNGGTISGAIQNHIGGGPVVNITKSGVGTWTLAGTNSYTGNTILNAGTLKLDYSPNNTSKLSDTGLLTLNGGTVDLAGTGSTHNEVVSFTTTGGGTTFVTRSSGSAILDLGQINSLTQSASTTNLSTTVTVADTSVLRVGMLIQGTGFSSRTITSIVDGTTITVSSAATATASITATLGTASLTSGAINFAAGNIAKTFTQNHSSGALASAAGNYRLTVGGTDWAKNDGSGNIIAFASGDYTTFDGTNAVTANINYKTEGNATLDANRGASTNTFKITTSGDNQSMALGANQLSLGSMLFAGANNYSITNTTGRIQTAFTLHNYGSGTLTLGNTNGLITQYGTGTTILTGNNASNVGINIFGGTVQFSNNLHIGTNTSAQVISLNNGTLLSNGSVTLDNGGANPRTVTLNGGGGTLAATTGNSLTVTGVISGTGNDMTIGSATNTGTVTLSGTNTYTGRTVIAGGNLSVGVIGNGDVPGNIGDAISAPYNIVFDGGTLAHTGASEVSDRAFTITAGKTATINTTNNLTLAGATGVATTGALTKTGNGTLTLTEKSTYTGSTTVSAGTLLVNGSTAAASAVGVSGTATLGGNGTVGGATTFTVTSIHAPGSAAATVGKQTFSSSVTYNSGSIFEWNLAATPSETGRGTNYDAVNAASLGATSGAIFRVVLDGAQNFTETFWDTGRTWSDIFKTGDLGSNLPIASIFNGTTQYYNVTTGDLGIPSAEGSFSFSGSDLNWTPIPEPTSALAGLLLTAGLLRRRRR